jgi:low affinity Fe/Cu permease
MCAGPRSPKDKRELVTLELIQNSQNRDSAAIQVKLDELIRVSRARNAFIGIEQLTEAEIEELREKCERRAKSSPTERDSR